MPCNRQGGFVLVATVWILAIITIAAAYFAERVSRSVALAQERQDAAEQQRVFANTRAEVTFRLGTTPMTLHGLGLQPAIALDDRPYRGTEGDVVRLQDNRGLMNVNFPDPNMMLSFLGQLGVSAEKRDAMMDTLRDYTDEDDLRRLNGAESAEYAALGLPPPPNDYLASPYQLKNVIGWRDQRALWERDRITQLVTTARVGGFNPNSAPLEVLASMPGSNLQIATAIVKARAGAPFRTITQLPGAAAGLSLDADYFLFAPGNSVRVTHQYRTLPWAVQYSITLTPSSERAPWRIDYYVRTAVSYVVENEDKIPNFPAWAPTPPRDDETL
jgi:DNA uptake protein ComE-like DNA-binding protein